ncbi:hypothetical protein [Persicobacter psychrovividus]|uniref:Uncharacterized protein n=1 Tax=Persicobacter psychrovividus TaxID=387638 RepID=A0ABN6L4Y8_9BACT|nr:hypothetical protein PEPS_04270 [Persicobacter psychrovividus]
MDCRLLVKKRDLIRTDGTAVGVYVPHTAFMRPENAGLYLGVRMKEGYGMVFFPVKEATLDYLLAGKITIRDIYQHHDALSYQIRKSANKAISVIRDEVEGNTLFWGDYFTDLDTSLLVYRN